MSSYAAFLDATELASKASKKAGGSEAQKRNVPKTLDFKLDRGERIVTALTSEIGAEKTAKHLEKVAKKAIGSQPRGKHGIVDLVSDDSDEEDARVPYGHPTELCC